MKTSLTLIVAATLFFVFTQSADAQWGCQQTNAYYAPSAAYYPSSSYYAPTTAYYGGGYGGGYYGGGYGNGYYGGYRGGMFGTGVGGWAGVRGINRRWDRRGW